MKKEKKKFWSDRVNELRELRFIDVRNMAHLHYKKPNGKELLSYIDTLHSRQGVRNCILQYELLNGMILPDYLDPKFQKKDHEREKTFQEEIFDTIKQHGWGLSQVEKQLKALKTEVAKSLQPSTGKKR